ncbi:hypothetical protein N7G274_005587 [Stereocaulon virgatum]|uniref:Integrase core domain-containing protein n=1 Tax=Stereocaulon virgatum TaxID=373712 RepID=A0ABR4A7Y5_9LECA
MPKHSHGGRPPKPIDNYKDEILDRLSVQHQKQEVVVKWLYNEKRLKIDIRTLQRRLEEWGFNQQDRTKDSEQLRNRIHFLFCKLGASDEEMLTWLKGEGFQVTKRGLVRVRKELGLKRLEKSQEARDHMDEKLKELIEQELAKNVIQSYGRGQLVEHFRKIGHPVVRDRLFSIYRTLAPDAVERRFRDIQRKRGECVIPGPNLVWSVDGHDKLSPYGIEIYGGADGHARYIPLVAYEADLKFQDCYMYGTSTSNQRIETWWAQLTKTSTRKWIEFFSTIREAGYFSKDCLADRIAILAVYFPTIRTEITHFVDNWNTHKIRKQPHRPKSIQGKPYSLFYHPKDGIKNYGLSLHEPTLQRLRQDIQDWDPDQYLPPLTLNWCNTFLRDLDFNPYSPPFLPPDERANHHGFLTI